jgi:hypothetical protein
MMLSVPEAEDSPTDRTFSHIRISLPGWERHVDESLALAIRITRHGLA